MKRRTRAMAAGLLCVAGWSASAADLERGMDAYQRGDYAAALAEFRPLAEQGDARAQAQYARMMALGQGMPTDLVTSLDWYEKSAAQGDAEGQYGLAYSYAHGEGVSQNVARAVELLKKADAQGYDRATTLLGEIRAGQFDDRHRDPARARALFERAAQAGNDGARLNLGLMLINGQGGPAEPERAIDLLKAQASSYPEAAGALGLAYEHGQGVSADIDQAARWYKIAADRGYGPAQISIGKLYQTGKGVERDGAAAAAYYRMAAEQGYATARYNLGHLYAEGEGVQQDDQLAALNYAIAAIDGVSGARNALDETLDRLKKRRVERATVLREAAGGQAPAYATLAAGTTVWPVQAPADGWVAVYAAPDGPRLGYVEVADLN